jgi:hypothetical protein
MRGVRGVPRVKRPVRRRARWLLVFGGLVVLAIPVAIVLLGPGQGVITNSGDARSVVANAGTAEAAASSGHPNASRRRHRHSPSANGSPTSSAAPTSALSTPPSTGGSVAVGHDCAANPHTCGFPDETNTGVAVGAALIQVPGQERSGPGWTWQTDHINVTKAGVTLADLDITGYIDVEADNVTLKEIRISENGEIWGVGIEHADNLTIENVDISSPAASGPDRLEVGIKDVYGDAVGTTIVNSDISHTSTAIQISNGVVEGNYIHDFGLTAGDHLNGISVGGGDLRSMLIKHNTVLDNYDQTDAIALFQDFGNEENKTITDNLLGGGSYTVYGGGPNEACTRLGNSAGCFGPSSNIIITNNRFAQSSFPQGGTFGYLSAFNPSGSGNLFSGNVWDKTGASVEAP